MEKSRLLKQSYKIQKVIYAIFRLLVLFAIGYIILYPLLHSLSVSIQSRDSLFASTRIWVPTDLDIKQNYEAAWKSLDYGNALFYTCIYQLAAAAIQIVSCGVAAYGFARFEFKGKNLMMLLLFISIIVPDMIVLIPRVITYSQVDFLGILGFVKKLTDVDLRLNLIDTGWTYWLPALFGVGLRSGILIYIYIQFFKGLPKELEEAAWVDGAGPIRTFLQIAVPSSRVVILTVSVFSVIWHWNDWLLCGIYLKNRFPLAIKVRDMLYYIGQAYGIGPDIHTPQTAAYMMAGCVLFVVPVLIIYIIIQRWFIESIDRVGITG